jgi:hypothetical protein
MELDVLHPARSPVASMAVIATAPVRRNASMLFIPAPAKPIGSAS